MRSADIFLFGRLAGRLVEHDEGGYSCRQIVRNWR